MGVHFTSICWMMETSESIGNVELSLYSIFALIDFLLGSCYTILWCKSFYSDSSSMLQRKKLNEKSKFLFSCHVQFDNGCLESLYATAANSLKSFYFYISVLAQCTECKQWFKIPDVCQKWKHYVIYCIVKEAVLVVHFPHATQVLWSLSC